MTTALCDPPPRAAAYALALRDSEPAAVGAELVRPAEWGRVREFTTAISDTPTALAITGEAGAGKSTLWHAGIDAAEAAGYRILRSEPTAGEIDLSFAGLSDLLAEPSVLLASAIPSPQCEALETALLLRPAGAEPPTERAVGLGTLAVLRAWAAAGPTLIAIDDVHWLDKASLNALVFAVRRLGAVPISLLVSVRTETPGDPLAMAVPPPCAGWSDLISAVALAEVMDLRPLGADQIQQLLPGRLTKKQARHVAELSRGNPFWARELMKSGGLFEHVVPPLAVTLTERLSESLAPPAADALSVVAAAGRIELADAIAVMDHLEDPEDAIDAAVLAGVVAESNNRLVAAHPLIGAAAVAALPPSRRGALYRRLAAQSHNPERYAHFAALAAGPEPDPAVASALDKAAEAAHARAANTAAAQFAVQAVQFTSASDEQTVVRRRIRAGELLYLAGDLERSRDQLAALEIDALSTAELERALPLLLDVIYLLSGATAATAIVRRALTTGGPDPRRRALVLSLASDAAYGMPAERRAAAEGAIRCAERSDPPTTAALHRAILNLVVAKVTGAEGLDTDLLDRAAALEAAITVPFLHDTADLHRGVWARYTEDLVTARQAFARCIERARDVGDDYAQWTFLCYLAGTEISAGDYTAAAVIMTDAHAAAEWHDWAPGPWHLEPRCDLLIAAGELDVADNLAAQLHPDDECSRSMAASIRGRVSLWRSDTDAAIDHFERASWSADRCDWSDPTVRNRIDPPLAEAYVAVGRVSEAEAIAERLRRVGEQLHRPALIGDAFRIDALMAAAAGDLDTAAQAARAAVDAHAASPLRLEHARSLLTLARIERRRKARREARTALEQANQLARDIDHHPLLAQIERELVKTGPGRAGPELTTAEQRVAELVADGATNRDAASTLFVSVRTVEAHVASIYRKLSVRNRRELARRLADDPRRRPRMSRGEAEQPA